MTDNVIEEQDLVLHFISNLISDSYEIAEFLLEKIDLMKLLSLLISKKEVTANLY